MGSEKRARRALLILGLVLLFLFLLSFSLGRYGVPPLTVVKILAARFVELFAGKGALQRSWTEQMEIAVVNIRLPRIVMACLVGCSLAAAGAASRPDASETLTPPLGLPAGLPSEPPWPYCWGRPPGGSPCPPSASASSLWAS